MSEVTVWDQADFPLLQWVATAGSLAAGAVGAIVRSQL
jgi:hypothetical protein